MTPILPIKNASLLTLFVSSIHQVYGLREKIKDNPDLYLGFYQDAIAKRDAYQAEILRRMNASRK